MRLRWDARALQDLRDIWLIADEQSTMAARGFEYQLQRHSPQKASAVHLNVLAGNEARAGTAEETHRSRDLPRQAAAPPQRVNERMMLRLRLPRRSRSGHYARGNRVDPDIVGGKLMRERARKPDQPGLGSHHMRPPRRADMRAQTSDVHDHAAACPPEMRQARLHAVECAVENNCGHRPPFRERHAVEGLLGPYRSIVDQNIDAAEMRGGGGDHHLHCVATCYIGDKCDGLAAGLFYPDGDPLSFPAVRARIDHDGGAALCERERDRASDVAARAGNEGNPPRQLLRHGASRAPFLDLRHCADGPR